MKFIGAFPVVKIMTVELGTCAYFADVSIDASFVAKYTFRPSLEIDRNGSMFQAYLIDPPLVPSREHLVRTP